MAGRSSWLLGMGVLLCVVDVAAAARDSSRPCTDPCLSAARGAARECGVTAAVSLEEDIDGCLRRDHQCVDACRFLHQECRDATGAGAEVAGCLSELEAAKEQCRSQFAIGSKKRATCIGRAETAGFQCRVGVRRRARPELRRCRRAFDECAGVCGPGEPPLGFRICKADARSEFKAARADCRQTLEATASGCLNKVVTCVPDCTDARAACNAPTQAALDAAIMACTAQQQAGVAACQAANPVGPALEQCIAAAQANAFVCRDAAVDAAAPGFAACEQQFARCVRACPPA